MLSYRMRSQCTHAVLPHEVPVYTCCPTACGPSVHMLSYSMWSQCTHAVLPHVVPVYTCCPTACGPSVHTVTWAHKSLHTNKILPSTVSLDTWKVHKMGAPTLPNTLWHMYTQKGVPGGGRGQVKQKVGGVVGE